MTEGENWLLNISDTETTVGCYGRRHLMYRDIKWCYVFYDVHAPICRQSPKLGDASNSGLDGDSLRSVAALFGLLQQRGKTVFVVSHDYELIISACSRIIKLHQGGVQHDFFLDAGSATFLWELTASGKGEAL